MIWELRSSKEAGFRTHRIVVAVVLIVLTAVMAYVKDRSETSAELDRQADSRLVQRMLTSPKGLAIVLVTNPKMLDHDFPVRLEILIFSPWREPNFDYLPLFTTLHFTADSGWSIDSTRSDRRYGLPSVLSRDAQGNTILLIRDLGFYMGGEMHWRPRTVAMLTDMEFEIYAHPLPHEGESYPNTIPYPWSPVSSIQMFVDAVQPQNHLGTLPAGMFMGDYGGLIFMPNDSIKAGLDPNAHRYAFHLNPDVLRSGIRQQLTNAVD